MKVEIGIAERERRAVVALLNTLLADEALLYTKTRNYHWNVQGPRFNDLHKFFDAQYQELNAVVDDVAERVRSLGGRPLGSLGEFLKAARLREKAGNAPDAKAMLAALLKDHEAVARALRKDIPACQDRHADVGTADFLTGLLEQHEKMAWMLRAFLTD